MDGRMDLLFLQHIHITDQGTAGGSVQRVSSLLRRCPTKAFDDFMLLTLNQQSDHQADEKSALY